MNMKKTHKWIISILLMIAISGTVQAQEEILNMILNPLTIILVFVVIVVAIFLLIGLTYISRYEVGIKTKKMFGAKMPQDKSLLEMVR